MPRSLERLKDAQREDAEAAQPRGLLVRLYSRSESLRQLAAVVGAVGALLGPIRWLYGYIQERRSVPAAELPKTGTPTVATDFVSEPEPIQCDCPVEPKK